jgi:Flp pilus assembly pilin Flp
MTRIVAFVRRLGRDRRGISSVEYALLLAFIGGGIILAANALSDAIRVEMQATANCISGDEGDCAGG